MTNQIPLDMMFEPTGILLKDYNAYCEVDGLLERDDLIDAVSYIEVTDPISGGKKLRTRLMLRNPPRNNLLPYRDFQPMAKAIPHCVTLDAVQFTGCGVTDLCLRRLAEAVYRSPSVTSVTVDFNGTAGLPAEPVSSSSIAGGGAASDDAAGDEGDEERPGTPEVIVTGAQWRNGTLTGIEDAAKNQNERRGGRGGASQPTGARAKQAQKEAEELALAASKPIAIGKGFATLCFTGIQHLCLRGNKINDEDVFEMAGFIEQPFSDLRCLNLWGNEITDAGVVELARAIGVSRRVTALDLGQNRIGDGGVEAVAQLFLTSDVTPDEAMRLRARTLTVLNTNGPVMPAVPPQLDPLPSMPSFTEIFASNGDDGSGGSPGGGADAGGASAMGGAASGSQRLGSSRGTRMGRSASAVGGGGSREGDPMGRSRIGGRRGDQFSIADRSRSDFDRDLVRLDDGRVRVPGCVQIVSLSFAHNPHVTDRGIAALERVLKTSEPLRSDEADLAGGGGVPVHYCSTLGLSRLEMANTGVSQHAMNRLMLAMQKVGARRTAAQATTSSP